MIRRLDLAENVTSSSFLRFQPSVVSMNSEIDERPIKGYCATVGISRRGEKVGEETANASGDSGGEKERRGRGPAGFPRTGRIS